MGGLLAAGGPLRAAPPAAPVLPLALPIYSNARTAETTLAALDCVAEAAGLQWQRQHVPQPRLQRLIDSGEALGLSVLHADQDREQRASQPFFTSHGWIVVNRETWPARSAALLRQELSVCVIRSDDRLLLPPFERAHGRPQRVELVDGDSHAALRMLARARCDALLIGSRLDHNGFSRQVAQRSEGQLQVLEQAFADYPVVFVASRRSQWARWLPKLDRAITECGPRIQALLAEEARRSDR